MLALNLSSDSKVRAVAEVDEFNRFTRGRGGDAIERSMDDNDIIESTDDPLRGGAM
jgi:hypothetical protein